MYIEHPVKILDEKERVTRNNVVKFYKVQWQNHSEDEATWEQESYILKHYPPSSFWFTEVVVCIEMYLNTWPLAHARAQETPRAALIQCSLLCVQPSHGLGLIHYFIATIW